MFLESSDSDRDRLSETTHGDLKITVKISKKFQTIFSKIQKPFFFNAKAASHTNRSAPPIPKSGCRKTTLIAKIIKTSNFGHTLRTVSEEQGDHCTKGTIDSEEGFG